MKRCAWAKNDLAIRYHDEEWGVPVHDDQRLFEFLILEGAQAGLSWDTILRKRDNYREAFDGFDPGKVARFSEARCGKLLQNEGIIRNRLKIASAVGNAKSFLKVQGEFGSFDRYIWDFVGGKPIVNKTRSVTDILAKTEISDAISKDLRRRGFNFVGSTIMYAFMQATGMVNDHLVSCFRYKEEAMSVDFPITTAVRFLREKKVDFTPHLYDYVEHGGTRESAKQLNVDEHAVVKTLVFETNEKKPLIVLMHGDREVSTKNLARHLGVKSVEPASAERATKWTGYLFGGTSPFGTKTDMPVYVEKTIFELEKIYINGGKRGFLVEIGPADLRSLETDEVDVAI